MTHMNDQPTILGSSYVNNDFSSFVGVETLNGSNTTSYVHIFPNLCLVIICHIF